MPASISGDLNMMRQLVQQSRTKLNKIQDQLDREGVTSSRVVEIIEQQRAVHKRLSERITNIEKRFNIS